MSFEIAKAGWLYRLSSVLKRWKRSWFVLYTDGVLKYFESENSHVAEEAYVVTTKCLLVKTGSQVANVTPPQGFEVSSLLMLVFVGDQTLTMCAESLDDMRAWQISLEQARVISAAREHPPPYAMAPPPPYSTQSVTVVPGYPGQTYYGSQSGSAGVGQAYYTSQPGYAGQAYYGTHPPPYMVQQPGTTVIYADRPDYRYRRGYDGSDVAVGVVAGAALGSLMWGPLLWW